MSFRPTGCLSLPRGRARLLILEQASTVIPDAAAEAVAKAMLNL